MPIVFILVDALRHDYLDYHQTAPFLSFCASNGTYIKQVRPSLGFCERVEILTGLGFPENGYFSAIGRNKGHIGPYRFLTALPNKWYENSFFRKSLKRVFNRTNIRLKPYNIPFNFLPDLVLTEDALDHTYPNAFQIDSLVDTFAEAGKKISWHYTALGLRNGSDEDRIKALKKSFSMNEADLYFLFLSPLDYAGHKYGPKSSQVGAALHTIDAQVHDLYKALVKIDQSTVLMVLGDHGMADVKQTFDPGRLLETIGYELGLKSGKDFNYFLDSTTCRIWGESHLFNKKRNKFLNKLEQTYSEIGDWLSGHWDESLYGEHIWLFREGNLVFPDFFHSNNEIPYKGMHGYAPENETMHGLCLIYSSDRRIIPRVIPEGNLGDVANTICALADVKAPRDSLGSPWIEKIFFSSNGKK